MARKKKNSRMFTELKQSLESALAYERGQSVDLRVTELPPPPKKLKPGEIKRIRLSFKASQAIFARALNVSPKAVASWEQGVRSPREATLKLLAIARRHPDVLLEA